MSSDEQLLLYHEKQVAALCGVHCVNSLLQGPYFTEIDLAQIAQELDAMERQFMQEGGITSEDYLKYMAEESGNVAADGMFSIQVLSKALEVWHLQTIPLDNPEVRASALEPQQEQAFICNLQEHWFTIRKVGSDWWNFNSLFPAPQPLSQFYLAAFLSSLKEQGYTIFVVRGELPLPQFLTGSVEGQGSAGQWCTPEQARIANEEAATARHRGKAIHAVENAFSKAMAQGGTLQLRSKRSAPSPAEEVLEDDDEDLAAAIAASLQDQGAAASSSAGGFGTAGTGLPGTAAPTRAHPGPSSHSGRPHVQSMEEDEEEDLAAAIAASLADQSAIAALSSSTAPAGAAAAPNSSQGPGQQPAEAAPEPEPLDPEPEAGPGVIELVFRLPGGQRQSRRFHASDPVSSIYKYLRCAHKLDTSKHVMTLQFPRRELTNSEVSLSATGAADRELLNVEVKR